jgi:hypothetical protein
MYEYSDKYTEEWLSMPSDVQSFQQAVSWYCLNECDLCGNAWDGTEVEAKFRKCGDNLEVHWRLMVEVEKEFFE